VTPTPRILTLAAATALALSLPACSSAPGPEVSATGAMPTAAAVEAACGDMEGVTLVVDASALGDDDEVSATWCVFADEPIAASDVLARAQVTTEGTEEYGDQVLCRVDGVPAEDETLPNPDGTDYVETCEAMPAAFAYWSLWVRPAGGEWDYAQEGLSTLQVEPGDALELLFSLNGEPAAPAPLP